MRRAKLEAQATDELDEVELQLISLEVERRRKDLEYRTSIIQRQHAARMKALDRVEVENAWVDFEDAHALSEAETIRRDRPKLNGTK